MDNSSVENPPLQVAAHALVRRLKDAGLNGIRFLQCRVANACSLQDYIDDGIHPDAYYYHLSTNVGMILEPDFPTLFDPSEYGGGDYVVVSFDMEQFYSDLEREIVTTFSAVGRIESVEINRHTHEVYVAMSVGVPT